ncbi:hypothetical protein SAMN02745176_01257 [Lutispora thermophila DSM 19022]|uniref:Uncharacterized protein n=1 Tax=Lutispora thermophila DSM 19022 TaxID=1122184 RepID=A0A1M6DRY0_9FIRM|nr:hypothetical protein SAMN02745176_01257 [Lutispora thermophila DSM 19022]
MLHYKSALLYFNRSNFFYGGKYLQKFISDEKTEIERENMTIKEPAFFEIYMANVDIFYIL